ncbi:MAG: ERF family protein [Actinobacteria bacterium]|nr:ERF family protein [Actinomycetota bacterium]
MIQTSETLEKLAPALAKAQGQIRGAKKDADNPFYKSKYADLASVKEAIQVPFAENGLSVVQTISAPEGQEILGVVYITTMLLHESGQWIRDTLVMKAKENTPQGIGSTITYGRRYGLAAIAGVAPEDDDGEAAQGRASKATAVKEAFQAPLRTAAQQAPIGSGRIVTPSAQ